MRLTRPLALAAVLIISTAACGGSEATTDPVAAGAGSPRASAPASPTAPADRSPSPAPVADPTFPTGIEPARITIPAIDVDAPFTAPLGMLSSTEMETPADPDDVGWFSLSRLPGEIGPAIVAGHVDSRTGPAVFYRLRDLAPGDEITIHADDGEPPHLRRGGPRPVPQGLAPGRGVRLRRAAVPSCG